MERSTVTGKNSKQKAASSKQPSCSSRLLTAHRSLLTTAGFTLLELMIVISIMIILVSVALPQFQKTIMHARETVLHDDLFKMRSLIDQYAADKGKLPQSLDDLVTAGYFPFVISHFSFAIIRLRASLNVPGKSSCLNDK